MIRFKECFLLALFLNLTRAATSTIAERATCIPTSAGDASVDDVPAIAAAIKSCGNNGIITIPAGKEYMIRSTLSFSECMNCNFQIEGTLKASDTHPFFTFRCLAL